MYFRNYPTAGYKLIPLTRVHLSKHYTTKTTTMYIAFAYRRIRDLTNIFRPDTEINGKSRH